MVLGSRHDDLNETAKKIFKEADLLGLDVIELRYNNNGQFWGTNQIMGFLFPRNVKTSMVGYEDNATAQWQVGTLEFFPNANGICIGYVIDIPENRKLIYGSFKWGKYRIQNRALREEIRKEAIEAGKDVEKDAPETVLIKMTKRETESINRAKNLEKQTRELKEKLEKAEHELDIANGKKAGYLNKRLAGKKIENREEVKEKLKNGSGD